MVDSTVLGSTPSESFPVKPYRPDGGFTENSVLKLVVVMVIAGSALGFLAHLVSQWFYLIFIFPLAIGFGIGFVGMKMVKLVKTRNPWIVGIAGFLAGCIAMLMMHYFDYVTFMGNTANLRTEMQEVLKMTPEQRQEILNRLSAEDRKIALLQLEIVRVNDFPGYMDFAARQGVEIKGHAGTSGGINLGHIGTYIYWVIEIIVVALVVFMVVKKAAAEPFCTKCNEWKKSAVLGILRGGPQSVAAAVCGGEIRKLAEWYSRVDGNLRLSTSVCPKCTHAGSVEIKLEELSLNKKGHLEAKQIAHVTCPGTVIPVLAAIFTSPASEAKPATAESAPQPVPQDK